MDFLMSFFVEIDCEKGGWKGRLKENLQDNLQVALRNFDYERDGDFCELLAVAHLIPFRIDYRKRRAFYSVANPQSPNANPAGLQGPDTPPSSAPTSG